MVPIFPIIAGRGPWSRALNVAHWVAAAFLLLYFGNVLRNVVPSVLQEYGWSQFLLAPLVALIIVLLASQLRSYVVFGLVLFGLYMLFAATTNTTPFSDFESFARDAGLFAQDQSLPILFASKSPSTVVWYSFFMALLPGELIPLWIGSATAWMIAALSMRLIVLALTGRSFTALVAGGMLGLSPGIIWYSGVTSSESVFVAFWLLGFALLLWGAKLRRWEPLALGSAALGFAYLAIPTSLFFFVAMATVLAVSVIPAWPSPRRRLALLALAVPFTAFVGFQIGLNWVYSDSISPSPTPFFAMALLSGTNQETNGAWALSDMVLAGYRGPNEWGSDPLPLEEANANAFRIGVDRIREDPLKFLKFAGTAKIERLWGGESSLLWWAVAGSGKAKVWKANGTYGLLATLSDAYLLFLLVGSTLSGLYLALRRRVPIMFAAFTVPLMAMSLLFVLSTVQQRYHLPYVPFLILLLAVGISQLSDRLRSRYSWYRAPSELSWIR